MAKAGESWLDEELSRREFTFGIKRLAEIVNKFQKMGMENSLLYGIW